MRSFFVCAFGLLILCLPDVGFAQCGPGGCGIRGWRANRVAVREYRRDVRSSFHSTGGGSYGGFSNSSAGGYRSNGSAGQYRTSNGSAGGFREYREESYQAPTAPTSAMPTKVRTVNHVGDANKKVSGCQNPACTCEACQCVDCDCGLPTVPKEALQAADELRRRNMLAGK